MFLEPMARRRTQAKEREADACDAEALRAQESLPAKDRFIEASMPFIRGSLRRIARRTIGPSDEEWSVGLVSFAEAVDAYRPERGHFPAFAYTVMARRMADFYRAAARKRREIDVPPHVFTGDADEETAGVSYAIQAAAQPAQEQSRLREELEAVGEKLCAYGFSFLDLTACSPQTEKTRRACAQAVLCLLRSESLYLEMRRKRALPARRIQAETGLPTKLLDRHRRYIIAVAVLMQGDYPCLQEYLRPLREEMRQ